MSPLKTCNHSHFLSKTKFKLKCKVLPYIAPISFSSTHCPTVPFPFLSPQRLSASAASIYWASIFWRPIISLEYWQAKKNRLSVISWCLQLRVTGIHQIIRYIINIDQETPKQRENDFSKTVCVQGPNFKWPSSMKFPISHPACPQTNYYFNSFMSVHLHFVYI